MHRGPKKCDAPNLLDPAANERDDPVVKAGRNVPSLQSRGSIGGAIGGLLRRDPHFACRSKATNWGGIRRFTQSRALAFTIRSNKCVAGDFVSVHFGLFWEVDLTRAM